MTEWSATIHEGYFHVFDNFACFWPEKSSLGNKPVLLIVPLNEISVRASDEWTLPHVQSAARDPSFGKQLPAIDQEMRTNK